jgi:hypothetical protein
MANLAPVPDGLTDEQVLMCPDIMSTGFGGAESADRGARGRHHTLTPNVHGLFPIGAAR